MSWRFEWFDGGVVSLPDDIRRRWNAAFEDYGNIWQCPDFVQCWDNTIAVDRCLKGTILLARDSIGHEIIYPLYARTQLIGGLKCCIVEPMGGETQCDYQDPPSLSKPLRREDKTAFRDGMKGALQKLFGKRTVFRAYRLSEEGAATENATRNTVAPYILLKGRASLDEILRERGRKLRQNVSRGLRMLAERGCRSLKRVTVAEVPEAMAAFSETYNKQWGSSLRNHSSWLATQAFWRALADAAARLNKVHLSALQVGDETWSWHLGFEHRKTFLWYKPTYNTDYARHSPGMLHLALAIQECIDCKVHVVDLGYGYEQVQGALDR